MINFKTNDPKSTTQPATVTGVSGGFMIPGWIGTTIGAAGSFLASCQGACYQAYPPFSGQADARSACLSACVTPIQTAPPVQAAGIGNIAALAIAGFIGYQLLKK